MGQGHLAEGLGLPAHELEQDIAAVLDRTLPLAVCPAVENHPPQSVAPPIALLMSPLQSTT